MSERNDFVETPITFCADGRLFGIAHTAKYMYANVWNSSGEFVLQVKKDKLSNAMLSPLGTYLHGQSTHLNNENTVVWGVKAGHCVASLGSFRWPTFLWTSDETHCLTLGRSRISLFRSFDDPSEMSSEEQFPFSLTEKQTYLVGLSDRFLTVLTTSYVSEKGTLFTFSLCDPRKSIFTRRIPDVEDGKIVYAVDQDTFLIHSTTSRDSTGNSYYGTSALRLASATKKSMKLVINLDEYVHDFAWHPHKVELVVLYGKMPNNECVVLDSTGIVLFRFPVAPRNQVRWTPSGRMVALGGIGALQGQFSIWDRHALGDSSKSAGHLGSFSMKCSQFEWSPCSRYILCSVVQERSRVENRIVIYSHNGDKIHSVGFECLWEARWLPNPSLPSFTPEFVYIPFNTNPSKSGVFVPKNKSVTASLLLQRSRSDVQSEICGVPAFRKENHTRHAGTPGAMIAREVKLPGSENGRGHESSEKPMSLKSPVTPVLSDSDAQDLSKRLRGLEKKLRQIEQLKSEPLENRTAEQNIKISKASEYLKETERIRSALSNA